MKDAVHSSVHRSVHLLSERKLLGDLRLRMTRRLILYTGKTADWAGATLYKRVAPAQLSSLP